MAVPHDYTERVYAGVLGKIIGVYLGRPFEGWPHDRIAAELGQICYYVHEKLGKPLVVADDDISGTFTFVRALPDYGNPRDLTPARIGQTWLNYLIDRRTILWWGGLGNSTEHTAYLRLKRGVGAPRSGSIALNGKVVAEQIGAQIFIDGWAMVSPGDPELAADLARRAASVSHDGEAIYGAQVVAAMEAQAFVEADVDRLIDTAVSFIPRDSVIRRLIDDVREWHARERDWRRARQLLEARYGYDRYGGNCHIVPNHGLIVLGLLYGDGDFQRSLMIVNTSGWDTDCNSGNLGCLLGIRNGLAGIDAGPDWRGPIADRLYLLTADGGRAITDAASEAYHIVNVGRALAGNSPFEQPLAPKDGARFHFELPGAVQGFRPEESVECRGTVSVENVVGHSRRGGRSLALRYRGVARGRAARVATPTFIPPEAIDAGGYALMASPTLYPGQTIRASLAAGADNPRPVSCGLYIRTYGRADQLAITRGPRADLVPGAGYDFAWQIGDTGGAPIAEVGVELSSESRADGAVYLDFLTWDGSPDVVLTRPPDARPGTETMWRRAWVDGVDQWDQRWPEAFRLVQNEGTGLLIQGAREWTDYRVSATIRPHMVKSFGLAARVQGMRRYYALLLGDDGMARLVKALDGDTVLGERSFAWRPGENYDLALCVVGNRVKADAHDQTGGEALFVVEDADCPLAGGGVALVCEEGRIGAEAVVVRPAR
ncbi:MAG: ADP-ribosylglycohydrolase family protein [Chloroflexi bacterium]|nr:ADP-ribosylglycohydrolase family protein [Chloroflexota bacterium]